MTMPLEPMNQSPIPFDMLMQLRESARGGMTGAAQRRMGTEQPQELTEGQTPEDVMLSDMEEQQAAEIEPPDIPQSAAQTMMRYGALQEYLMRARGELPNA